MKKREKLIRILGMILMVGLISMSVDSRTYGPFSITQTRGKVLMPKR